MGSSPLARGLRRQQHDCRPGQRIIPARAGFTTSSRRRSERRRDHPRSRRVYDETTGHGGSFPGSSPLARGLPRLERIRTIRMGIIPARAGFTLGPPRWRRRAHGSSPLARGLRGDPLRPLAGGRIIPARAGFTCPPTSTGPPAPDHPRSRGVYRRSGSRPSGGGGSSPLARGLHSRRPGSRQRRRIIPARAGFTVPQPAAGGLPGDHPRSRGVYRELRDLDLYEVGSSPLARGLRYGLNRIVQDAGIIPARAGFTRT